MIYMTENMVKLAKELAAFAVVEIVVRESELLVRATPCKAPPREKGSRTVSKNGRILGRPEYRRAPSGRRLKLWEFGGERKTADEWAEKYGVKPATMKTRLHKTGTPETTRHRGKGEKSSLKAKLSK